MQWSSTNIVVSESADKTSTKAYYIPCFYSVQVLKCITLLPANPALPMVEVTVLLVAKKC